MVFPPVTLTHWWVLRKSASAWTWQVRRFISVWWNFQSVSSFICWQNRSLCRPANTCKQVKAASVKQNIFLEMTCGREGPRFWWWVIRWQLILNLSLSLMAVWWKWNILDLLVRLLGSRQGWRQPWKSREGGWLGAFLSLASTSETCHIYYPLWICDTRSVGDWILLTSWQAVIDFQQKIKKTYSLGHNSLTDFKIFLGWDDPEGKCGGLMGCLDQKKKNHMSDNGMLSLFCGQWLWGTLSQFPVILCIKYFTLSFGLFVVLNFLGCGFLLKMMLLKLTWYSQLHYNVLTYIVASPGQALTLGKATSSTISAAIA